MLIEGAIAVLVVILLMALLRRGQVAGLRRYGVTKELQEASRYVEPDPGAEDEEC